MAIGFRVLKRSWTEHPELVEAFRGLPVANISDVMSRMDAGGTSLRPYHDGTYLCGQALTVKARPGDNLVVHKALDMARPGDVVVVDVGGDLTNAIFGELMLAHAVGRRLGGIIIDGAIRDLAAVRKGSFPVYAAGVTHRGPYKDGPGEINVAISVGGMVVRPGDIVVGDEDGVLAIPLEDAAEVLKDARAKRASEQAAWEQARAGTRDRSWVDEQLKSAGCVFE